MGIMVPWIRGRLWVWVCVRKLSELSFEWEVVGEAEQRGFWELHSLHVVI